MRWLLAVSTCVLTSSCFSADPALTIYNQQFAVVRETISLDLKSGLNQIAFTGATSHLEPESVMLRDPSGQRLLRILEQNYRADPVSVEALLKRYEGQTIEFQVRNGDRIETVSGKIVRAGNASQPGWTSVSTFNSYPPPQMPVSQPIIEVAGKLRFELPGVPLFPALGPGMILEPTLDWTIETERAGLERHYRPEKYLGRGPRVFIGDVRRQASGSETPPAWTGRSSRAATRSPTADCSKLIADSSFTTSVTAAGSFRSVHL